MKKGFKVIEIIDEYSILINYGSVNGANKGDDVRVIAKGPEVFDPETNQSLGTMDRIKANLTVISIYEHFSRCQQIKERTVNSLLNPLAQLQITTLEKTSLNVDENEMSHKKLPDDYKIRVGDMVEIL